MFHKYTDNTFDSCVWRLSTRWMMKKILQSPDAYYRETSGIVSERYFDKKITRIVPCEFYLLDFHLISNQRCFRMCWRLMLQRIAIHRSDSNWQIHTFIRFSPVAQTEFAYLTHLFCLQKYCTQSTRAPITHRTYDTQKKIINSVQKVGVAVCACVCILLNFSLRCILTRKANCL